MKFTFRIIYFPPFKQRDFRQSLRTSNAERFCFSTLGTWPLVIRLPINTR